MTGTGLLRHYPLHDEDGDMTELVENDEGVLDTNAPTRGLAGRGGIQSVSGDGSQYVQTFTPGDPISFAAWVFFDDLGSQAHVLEADDGSNQVILRAMSDNTYEWIYYDGTTVYGIQNAGSAPVGEWVHLAASYDPSAGYELFENGSSIATSADTTFTAPTSVYQLLGIGGNKMRGDMCDARFYNRRLTAAEATALYEWGSGDYVIPADNDDNGVTYWTLDEDSGSTAADSWGSNDGSISGATLGASAIRDTGFNFDGTDDYVQGPSKSNSSPTYPEGDVVTIAGWVKFDSLTSSSSDIQILFGREGTDAGPYNITLSEGGPNFSFDIYTDSSSGNLTFGDSLVTGSWYHLAGVYGYNTGEARAYINGALRATTSVGGTLRSNSNEFNAGANAALGKHFHNGTLDDIRLYNRALSTTEIHDLYRYGSRGRDLREQLVNA